MDAEALLHERNDYAPGFDDIARVRNILTPAYHDYVATVSRANMAIALETAVYAYWLCGHVGASSVGDYGSGFTSYVLRRYAEDVPWHVDVVSVDDDSQWLGKTAAFLTKEGQGTDGLTLWREDLDLPKCDVTVYDFGGGEFRERWMAYALARTNVACVLDDAMHEGHRTQMETTAAAEDMTLCSLELWTRDQYMRYAALAFR